MQRQLIESRIGLNKRLASQDPMAGKRRVQSAQTLENGNIGYLDAFTGEVVDTGAKAGTSTKIVEIEGKGKFVFDPIERTMIPLATEGDIQESMAGRERTTVQAREEQKAETQAQLALPERQAAAQRLRGQIEELLTHEGKRFAVGGVAGITPRVPGTPQASFIDRLDQINAAAFLEAFQQLKGGGPITDREGQKATEAISRMKRSTSVKEFDMAAQELIDLINEGVGVTEQKASGEVFGKPTKRFNKETGKLEPI
jgi:hypothetical protein